jgi:RNA polymerase sigma-70 factor, ECF subfamily
VNVDDFVVTARASWPEWPNTDATAFAQFVSSTLGEVPFESLHAKDLWLAFHAGRGLPQAVAALESSCFSDLPNILRARRAEPAEVDEVVQRLRDRLLVAEPGEQPKILTYGGRGELRAWVRVAAVRGWLNLKREQGQGATAFVNRASSLESTADEALAAEASSDLELELLKGKYKEIFRKAFLDTVTNLAPGARLLLKLHYLDRLSMEDVGKILGVHRLTVLRRLERARQELSEGTKERLEMELRLAPPDVESLLRLIQSRLDVSLQQALADTQLAQTSTGGGK